MKPHKGKVFVGLSGGVDSSVSLKRCIDEGYEVTGVFIKTWQPDFIVCNWEAERLDAMRVAARLKIPFLTCDAEQSYKDDVADYMIAEYSKGRTPNPDVMCNRYVKFGTFLRFAKERGAEWVATGHYAQVKKVNDTYELHRGIDVGKDQSYFLWTLTQDQLSHTLFPVGDSLKNRVREEAAAANLITANKNDSQGICFLGQIDIQEFLSHYITVSKGDVLDESGNVIGSHDGALYYTMGQRHGFQVTTSNDSSAPHFVVEKNVSENTITVATKQSHIDSNAILLSDINLIGDIPSNPIQAQFRYRQEPFQVEFQKTDATHGMLRVLDHDVEIPSAGQSCVLYSGARCLGGGIIESVI